MGAQNMGVPMGMGNSMDMNMGQYGMPPQGMIPGMQHIGMPGDMQNQFGMGQVGMPGSIPPSGMSQ